MWRDGVVGSWISFTSVFHLRCPVEDSSGHICHIVTQSMLIDFLWRHIEVLDAKRHMTVGEMQLPLAGMVSVKSTMRTLDALALMIEKGVSGLPIVNEEGALIDNISIRDLRVRPPIRLLVRKRPSGRTHVRRCRPRASNTMQRCSGDSGSACPSSSRE